MRRYCTERHVTSMRSNYGTHNFTNGNTPLFEALALCGSRWEVLRSMNRTLRVLNIGDVELRGSTQRSFYQAGTAYRHHCDGVPSRTTSRDERSSQLMNVFILIMDSRLAPSIPSSSRAWDQLKPGQPSLS